MFVITKESQARKIFEKYTNVAAFALGKAKGISEDKLKISYAQLKTVLPDDDTINAVVSGHMSSKKAIKNSLKAIAKYDKDANTSMAISVAQLISMNNEVIKKAPAILVFVLDDDYDSTSDGRSKAKFLTKYIVALFGEFGIAPVEFKKVKKIFKGKKKKVIEKVQTYLKNHSEARISSKGTKKLDELFTFFSTEIQQASIANLDMDKASKDTRKILIKRLLDVYTNNNLTILESKLTGPKKDKAKLIKKLRAKNREAVESYTELVALMMMAGAGDKFPKVKSGYTKAKKKKKSQPKMNIAKFGKFYEKRDNAGYLALIFAHTAMVSFGVEVGSPEYNKMMASAIVSNFNDNAFSKAFTQKAKEYKAATEKINGTN